MSGRSRWSLREWNPSADVSFHNLKCSTVAGLKHSSPDMIATERQRSSGLSIVEAPKFNWLGLISALMQERVSTMLISCLQDLTTAPDPANGVQLKIWQCYDNLPAQQWYYTTDNRIALANQGNSSTRCTSS